MDIIIQQTFKTQTRTCCGHINNSRWSADKETTFKNLEEAIKILKDEQRICIELFYLQEKSYKEVSDLTGLSLLNVKSHIQNGKRNLKIILERGHGQ